jgi:polysaccharide pyruvyl transferase WcaK-like protein
VLASIGLKGDHIHSTCDDALLCDRYGDEDIRAYLDRLGGAPSAWAVVNFHHWGMPDSEIEVNEKRFSTLCDYISTKYNVCCLLVSMAPSDVLPCVNISRRMSQESMVVPYSPDYRVARSLIASAKFCFTMKHHPIVFAIGESTPVVSVCLDDYYNLKNKGVMDNIGYGHNAAVKEEFFTSAIYSLIDAAIASREDFQASCAEYVRQQQSLELEPYQEAALYLPS